MLFCFYRYKEWGYNLLSVGHNIKGMILLKVETLNDEYEHDTLKIFTCITMIRKLSLLNMYIIEFDEFILIL